MRKRSTMATPAGSSCVGSPAFARVVATTAPAARCAAAPRPAMAYAAAMK